MTTTASSFFTLLIATVALAQPEASISVTGNVRQPVVLKAAELAQMPRATTSTTNSGVTTTWEGVWLHEILQKAGLGPGIDQPGYVVASAADNYQALFSLGELDPSVSEPSVLVADKANGKPLTGRDGTFRLVASRDIRGVRAVRQLVKIEVILLKPPAN